MQALLRCWVREAGVAVPPAGGVLRLDAAGTVLLAPVEYRSATGWHRFGQARLAAGPPAGATLLAALLGTEAGAGPEAVADLVERVVDSTRRIASYVAARSLTSDEALTFLVAEQALVAGHPLHPTPKSRTGLSPADELGAAPELRGSAPLHWFAADPTLVRHGSAGLAAPERIAALAPWPAPPGMLLVPAHFWQARELLARPDVQKLLEQGLLRDLGQAGPPWSATSSIRTLYRAAVPAMLKLSLGVRVTNSRREHLLPELVRGAEMYALVEAGLGSLLAVAHPGFRILGDPAWLAVALPDDEPDGRVALAVSIRDSPFDADARVACVAGLVAERPDQPSNRSALTELIETLAASRPTQEIALEWLGRYIERVIAPILWLHGVHGLGLEAHQQNTLVSLDAAGWPVGGWYRDNQGYYLSPTRADGLHALLPGLGAESDATNPDDVIDQRLAYYVGVNNLLGLIGALGAAGLADEVALLATARRALEPLRHEAPLAATLLDAPTLPCKGNLLTRVAGLDELVGPVETQSVYVRIANPLSGGQG
jgi:siderophore synthetase component